MAITLGGIYRPYTYITAKVDVGFVESYQWQIRKTVNGFFEDLPFSTEAHYYIGITDVGKAIRVKAVVRKLNNELETQVSNPVAIATLPKLINVRISNIGTLSAGDVCIVADKSYTVKPYKPVQFLYSWVKNAGDGVFTPIAYATKSRYTITLEDYGTQIACRITAIGGASETVLSNIIDIPVPEKLDTNIFRNGLKNPIIKAVAKLTFLNPDQTVQRDVTLDMLDLTGNLNISLSDGIRRTLGLRIDNAKQKYNIDINKLWFGQMLSLELGIFANGRELFYPQGVFYIQKPTNQRTNSDKILQITAVDKWGFLNGTIFGNLGFTHKTNINTNIYTAIRTLLQTDRGNGMPLDFKEPIFTNYYIGKYYMAGGQRYYSINTPYLSEVSFDKTYADILSDYRKMLVAQMYYNVNGHLVVESAEEKLLDSDKEVQWTFTPKEAELQDNTEGYKFHELYNDVIIYGATTQGHTAMGRATNKNPHSDTNAYIIGNKTKTFSDKNYYSDEQCNALARYHLKKLTILQKSISITCTPMYHLDVNKLIDLAKFEQKGKNTRYLISNITIPMDPTQRMQIEATSVSDLDFSGEGAI